MPSEPDQSASQAAADNALAEYFRRMDDGHVIDQEAFLAEYAEAADELRAYFSQEGDLVDAGHAETAAFDGQATPRNALLVRCPHCHTPNHIAVDASLVDLTCPNCGSTYNLAGEPSQTRAAKAMSQVGHFELIERLGVGGFGSVWKARDTKLDRPVAVKIPRQGQMDAEETEKFLREARAAAQLKHQNIVAVHEVGRDGETVYIVSDLIQGISLDDWLTGQQLTNREAAELCVKIANALHHAHEQGVVHRDLKPGNILIDGDGEPHLVDFGLARREAGEVTMTIDGQVLGTPAYMSPEQAQGESHSADRRSDVYSLGVILFRLLTGELPFRGNARMLMHQMINDEPPSPRKFNAGVSKDLETITLKCLEKAPDRRYPTSLDLAEELRRNLRGEPISARPVGRVERAWRWARRKPALALTSIGLVVLGMLGAVLAWSLVQYQASKTREIISLRKEAAKNRADAEIALHAAEKKQARAKQVAAASERKAAESAAVAARNATEAQNAVVDAFALKATAAMQAGQPDLALNWALLSWQQDEPSNDRSHQLQLSAAISRLPDLAGLAVHDYQLIDADYSPESDIACCYGYREGRLTLWRLSKGKRLEGGFERVGGIAHAFCSHDGSKVIASYEDGCVRIWSIGDLSDPAHVLPHSSAVSFAATTRDGQLLATVSDGGKLRLWSLSGTPDTKWENALDAAGAHVQFCNNGAWLLSLTRAGEVQFWDTASGEKLFDKFSHTNGRSFDLTSPYASQIKYTPVVHEQSKQLCVVNGNTVIVHSLAGEKEPLRFTNKRFGGMTGACFNAAGDKLLLTAAENTYAVLWDLTKDSFKNIPTAGGTALPCINEEGGLMAVASSRGPVYVIDTKDFSKRLVLEHGWYICKLAFVDNTTLFVASTDGTARLWRIGKGKRMLGFEEAVTSRSDLDWKSVGGQHAPQHNGRFDIDVSQDGSQFALRITDNEEQRVIHESKFNSWYPPEIAPSSSSSLPQVIINNNGAISLVRLRGDQFVLTRIPHPASVDIIKFSNSGRRFLTGGTDGVIRVWDSGRLKMDCPMLQHREYIRDAAFSPDEQLVAVIAADSKVRVWNSRSGQLQFPVINSSQDLLWRVKFSPDGKTLYALGRKHVSSWELDGFSLRLPEADRLCLVLTGRQPFCGSNQGRVESRLWAVEKASRFRFIAEHSRILDAWLKWKTTGAALSLHSGTKEAKQRDVHDHTLPLIHVTNSIESLRELFQYRGRKVKVSFAVRGVNVARIHGAVYLNSRLDSLSPANTTVAFPYERLNDFIIGSQNLDRELIGKTLEAVGVVAEANAKPLVIVLNPGEDIQVLD